MDHRAGTARAVSLVVPGPLATLTGGYIYDRRMIRELSALGWQTRMVPLDSGFPSPTVAALEDARAEFDAMADGSLVVIDGLALAGLLPLLPSLDSRLNPIALIHHPLADETGLSQQRAAELEAAETQALQLMPRIIVTSHWTRRRLADYAVEPERVAVIVPGVDRAPVRWQPPSSSPVRLLTVATITPRKGHLDLIEALGRLKPLDWSLRLAGGTEHDPAYVDSVLAAIEREGLGGRVTWLGELPPERVAEEYAAASLFVLPSYLEGYGMALAEAIAYGLPVLSTTAGAIPDTVPASASRLVPPGDIDSLTHALGELILDGAAREVLARGARAAADAVPTWRVSAERFAAVLTEHVNR